ncbi:uncharacterized protein LOC100650656 isoform X1 [Bombus terrestris]|uniref:Uncharacterized protein LOC100650656 isoform X1 n=1 Tax=Bombus terrestris TaxID=30195 RepID=A0A9C6SDV6_BOMTE|nr:uncharacterized protein LOC100650656 isoform X1 [Bombus terrestris]
MDWQTIEFQYLKTIKFFGQLVGVWPYQEEFRKITMRFVTSIVTIVCLVTQISRILTFYSLDILLEQMPHLDVTLMIVLKQYNYILNEKKLKELLSEIVAERLIERPKRELEILDIYSQKAMIMSFIYKVSTFVTAVMFALIPAVSPILNIVAPLNESRSRELIYPAYYFVDEERYYYVILVHMVASVSILVAVYIACDTSLIHFVQHGCALLAISGGYVFSWNTIVMNETSEDRNACNVITLLRISISSRRKRPNICRHFL